MQDLNATLDIILKILAIIGIFLLIFVSIYAALVLKKLSESIDQLVGMAARVQNAAISLPQNISNKITLGAVRTALDILKNRFD